MTATILPFPVQTAAAPVDTKREALRAQAAAAINGRDSAIKAIREALKKTTGRVWSVTGGRGTAWGWITVTAPPARRTWESVQNPGALNHNSESYDYKNTGTPDRYMSPDDMATLETIFGTRSRQHESIPARDAYYRVALAKALTGGDDLGFTAERYWD